MMRIFYLVLLILILIFIGMIPWADGYLFKQNYLALINSINAENNSRIKVLEYRLGWLGSYAKLYIESSSTPKIKSGITVEQTISHGPFVHDPSTNKRIFARAIIQSDISMPSVMKKVMVNQNQTADLHADTQVTLSGDYHTQFSTPAFMVAYPSLFGQVIWGGIKGQSELQVKNNQISQIDTSMMISPVSSQGGQNGIGMQEITIKHIMTRQPIGLWNSSLSIIAPGLTLTDPDGVQISIAGFDFNTEGNVDAKNRLSHQSKISINSLSTRYISLLPSTISYSIQNINGKALVDISRELSKTSKTMNFTPEILINLTNRFPQLLTPETLVTQQAAIATQFGKLIIDGKQNWSNTPYIQTMDGLIKNSNVKINVSASIPLVNEIITVLNNEFKSTHPVSTSVNTLPSSEDELIDQITSWANQDQIALDVSFNLKNLVKKHLSLKDFSRNVDDFVTRKEISSDMAMQLKSKYGIILPTIQGKTVSTTPVVTKSPPEDSLQNTINFWVKKGYIKIVNDNYVTQITVEKGVLKLNGIEFVLQSPPEPPKTVMQPPAPVVQPSSTPVIQTTTTVVQPRAPVVQTPAPVVPPAPIMQPPAPVKPGE